jgi:hypothetical protein
MYACDGWLSNDNIERKAKKMMIPASIFARMEEARPLIPMQFCCRDVIAHRLASSEEFAKKYMTANLKK